MPPRLGEHSRAVLQEAGLSDEEIASLVEKQGRRDFRLDR